MKLQMPALKKDRLCNFAMILLLFICFLGILLGTILAGYFDEAYVVFLQRAPASPVSVIGWIGLWLLPFILAFYFRAYGKSMFLYCLCFIKAVAVSFCSMSCCYAFGSGSWLIRIFLQFSDLLLFPFLCWFCLRYLSEQNNHWKLDAMICSAACAVVCLLDFCIVSPYLVMLIDY